MQSMWNFITRAYDVLPIWAKVPAFFLILLSWIYLYLAPRFANGQIVVESPRGGVLHYRGTQIHAMVDGRLLKFKSNENGYWSVPVVSRLPGAIRLQVFHQDAQTWFDVKLPWSDLWLNRTHRLVVTNEPNAIRMARHQSFGTRLANFFSPPAYAGKLVLPGPVTAPPPGPDSTEPILVEVDKAIAAATGLPVPSSPDTPLTGPGAPSYVQRIQIINNLESQYNLRIPDEHWQQLRTNGELADYLQKRSALKRAQPDVYKQRSYWSVIQSRQPPKERAVFVK